MQKKFWNNMKIITILSLLMTLVLGSDIPWKELHRICFSWPLAKSILYDISVGIFSSMILVWCIDRIQLKESEKQEAKQRLILYNKLAPVLTKYYEFYLFLYIATRNKPVDSNDKVLEGLYYCIDEFIMQIRDTNPFYKDGYYADAMKIKMQMNLLNANSNNQQNIDQIMKMSTKLPWYKCWCKDGTEFYNNVLQIERDYVTLFPSEMIESIDKLLSIVGAQRYLDEMVEGNNLIDWLPRDINRPPMPVDFFIEAYQVEELLKILDEIMVYIENDSTIKLRARELKFFNERNVCPLIGHSCDKNTADIEEGV